MRCPKCGSKVTCSKGNVLIGNFTGSGLNFVRFKQRIYKCTKAGCRPIEHLCGYALHQDTTFVVIDNEIKFVYLAFVRPDNNEKYYNILLNVPDKQNLGE